MVYKIRIFGRLLLFVLLFIFISLVLLCDFLLIFVDWLNYTGLDFVDHVHQLLPQIIHHFNHLLLLPITTLLESGNLLEEYLFTHCFFSE